MEAEQILKQALDGTFTKVDQFTGKVITSKVPLDFIPKHSAPQAANMAKKHRPRNILPRLEWTSEMEERLQKLRDLGWSKLRCAMHFNTTEDAIRHRLVVIRTRGSEA